jgi:hypothetical protein
MNPSKKIRPEDVEESAYPQERVTLTEKENRWLTYILSVLVVMIPITVCLVCNLVINKEISWSAYAIGGVLVMWILIVPPIFIKKNTALICAAIDTVAIILMLYGFEKFSLTDGTEITPWFLPLALPIVVSVSGFAFILILTVQSYRMSFWNILSLLMAMVSLLVILLEGVTDLRVSGEIRLNWSPIVVAPCLILALISIVVSRKRRLKNSLRKRFHV